MEAIAKVYSSNTLWWSRSVWSRMGGPLYPHTSRIQGTHLKNQRSNSLSPPEHTLQTRCLLAKNIKKKKKKAKNTRTHISSVWNTGLPSRRWCKGRQALMVFLMKSLIKVFNGVTVVNIEFNTVMEALQSHFLAFTAHYHLKLIDWYRSHSEVCWEKLLGIALS